MIYEFCNIHKSYGKIEILKGIDFQLFKGKITGILGPNGSGKTTIMKLMAQLTTPTFGLIRKHYNDLRIRCLIEESTFYNGISGYSNLEYLVSDLKNIKKKDINNVIYYLKMQEYIHNKVGTYSLGMKQKLAIAFALIGDVNLLVLDEPINGLDPIAIIEMRELFIDLARKKDISILISSHILNEIQHICDDILLLKNGEIRGHFEIRNNIQKKQISFLSINDYEKAKLILNDFSGQWKKEYYQVILHNSNMPSISQIIKLLAINDINIVEAKLLNNDIEQLYRDIIIGGDDV